MRTTFQRKNALFLFALALLAGQAACAAPSLGPTPFQVGGDTRAAPATRAPVTRVIALPPASPTSPAGNKPGPGIVAPTAPGAANPTPQPENPLLPQSSRPGQGEAGDRPCDKAAPGSPIDITIPDNTQMFPGQGFTKTWRLVNAGSCRWTREYSAEWFSGARLGDTLVVHLSEEVPPGESLDLTVDMVAPETPGAYQSNWKLRNAQKEWFGIGPDGDQVFWVRIVVVALNTDTPRPTATTVPPTPTPTFEPTLTTTQVISPTATPVVLLTGEASLAIADRLDLDSGQVNAESEDLTFQKDERNNHWLVPQGGAFLGVLGGNPPTLPRCLAANMSAAPIPLESLSPGTYLCYRTGLGAPGWLQYDSFQVEGVALKVLFLTWALP